MALDDARTKHVFFIEMWREDPAEPSWRGIVKHVAHGRQRYFASLRDLTDFIALRLEAAPAGVRDASDIVRED